MNHKSIKALFRRVNNPKNSMEAFAAIAILPQVLNTSLQHYINASSEQIAHSNLEVGLSTATGYLAASFVASLTKESIKKNSTNSNFLLTINKNISVAILACSIMSPIVHHYHLTNFENSRASSSDHATKSEDKSNRSPSPYKRLTP